MITKENLLDTIFNEFPEYQESDFWKEHLTVWKRRKTKPGLSNQILNFAKYISCVLDGKNANIDARHVFSFIENIFTLGDKETQIIITDSFLKLLMYYSATNILKPNTFTHLLGNKSRIICKEYRDYLGVTERTIPGL